MYFVHLIADYGIGDPAFGEVIHCLKSLDNKIDVYPTSVPPFSTIATGFWIAQYGFYNPTFEGLAIYSNTAPRKDKMTKRDKNQGEKLAYALLDNNVPILAVQAGYSFSFVKDHIKKFSLVNVQSKGSQFRSRDFFPSAVVGILHGKPEYIGQTLDVSQIPNPPADRIAAIDGFGNIKTTIRKSFVDLFPGDNILVRINDNSRIAIFAENNFAVKEGELAFAPGSSGGNNSFLELFLRGGNAEQSFNFPQVEDSVSWKMVE